jgi:hypothetical protein
MKHFLCILAACLACAAHGQYLYDPGWLNAAKQTVSSGGGYVDSTNGLMFWYTWNGVYTDFSTNNQVSSPTSSSTAPYFTNGVTGAASPQSVHIDGVQNYVNSPTSATLWPPNAFTFMGWIYLDSYPPTGKIADVFHLQAGGDNDYIQVNSNGTIGVNIQTSGGFASYSSGSHTLLLHTAYHIACSYDTVNGTVGYVNGAIDGQVAPNGAMIQNSTPTWFFGEPLFGSAYLNARLQGFRLYPTNETQAFIQNEYNGGFY